MVMIAGACPGLTGAALIVYVLGFRMHPHRVTGAFSFAGAYVAFVIASNWLIYRISRRRP
jgi:hypothetical protein